MDTKSRNYHKLAVAIILLVILLPSLAMMFIRPHYITKQNEKSEIEYADTDFLSLLVKNTYVLYGEENKVEQGKDTKAFSIFFPDYVSTDWDTTAGEGARSSSSVSSDDTEEYNGEYEDPVDLIADTFQNMYDNWTDSFSAIRSYIEYEVLDGQEKTVLDTNRPLGDTSTTLYETLTDMKKDSVLKSDCDYAFVAIIEYGKSGNIKSTTFLSHEKDNTTQALNEIARIQPDEELKNDYYFSGDFQPPQDRIYCFAMTQKSMASFINLEPYTFNSGSYYDAGANLLILFLTLLGFVCAAALLLPLIKPLQTGNEKIFQVPFEPVCFIALCILSISASVTADPSVMNQQSIKAVLTSIGFNATAASILQYIWGLIGWLLIFAVCYWTIGCFRHIFTLGIKEYIKTKVLIYRIWPWLKKNCRSLYQQIRYSLLHIDLRDNASRILLKIVLINFIILGFISLLWVWGLGALAAYSVALFFLLRKYVRKIQEQYKLLLSATNELAKGNLNGTIPEDLGIFEPFRDEIDKIQSGFKKAVDEEVKSTKMKTDLITNVSHDLKTPLTAIITYVDLLKKPGITQEEQEKYIGILDQKANRLKVLIEDLFEISKATSKTVSLNIMDIDIVSLLKQVRLELQDKIESTDLIFRWQLPEDKIILPLDSQRTYRVFENLLVNITKYAMPYSRVYITMEDTENHVKITMKNVSATELDFSPGEITERFVRGDASRNTEGSGLGLAIAKSFTELQGGRLEVFIDADLFTVEITFLKPQI